MRFLASLYARRIVNVNVNIIAAGLLALIPLTLTVHIATTRFGLEDKIWISALSFFADVFFDVAIYFVLHWLANHSPLRRRHMNRPPRPSFIRDASLVQFERALISPLLYLVALGLQQVLMRDGASPEVATAIGFACGIATSRIVHTAWMIWSGQTH